MIDFNAMSDFEINKYVCAKLDIDFEEWNSEIFVSLHKRKDNIIPIQTTVDFCNNPNDAWPIIKKYRIGVYPGDDSWLAMCDDNLSRSVVSSDENPLRAAMISMLKANI